MNIKLRILVSSLVAAGMSFPASGQNTFTNCADIEDAEARLACYDAAAERNQDLPVVRLPRASQVERAGQIDGDMPQGNGSNRARPADFDVRTFVVAAAKHNDFTGWTIEFEGGGVWKQIGTDDFDIDVGESYIVRKASFNSYMLSRENSNRKIRIKPAE